MVKPLGVAPPGATSTTRQVAPPSAESCVPAQDAASNWSPTMIGAPTLGSRVRQLAPLSLETRRAPGCAQLMGSAPYIVLGALASRVRAAMGKLVACWLQTAPNCVERQSPAAPAA